MDSRDDKSACHDNTTTFRTPFSHGRPFLTHDARSVHRAHPSAHPDDTRDYTFNLFIFLFLFDQTGNFEWCYHGLVHFVFSVLLTAKRTVCVGRCVTCLVGRLASRAVIASKKFSSLFSERLFLQFSYHAFFNVLLLALFE